MGRGNTQFKLGYNLWYFTMACEFGTLVDPSYKISLLYDSRYLLQEIKINWRTGGLVSSGKSLSSNPCLLPIKYQRSLHHRGLQNTPDGL